MVLASRHFITCRLTGFVTAIVLPAMLASCGGFCCVVLPLYAVVAADDWRAGCSRRGVESLRCRDSHARAGGWVGLGGCERRFTLSRLMGVNLVVHLRVAHRPQLVHAELFVLVEYNQHLIFLCIYVLRIVHN